MPSSTVYGPVSSWRLGPSLGVDLLFRESICSFRCCYCQLGEILLPTRTRQVFVNTAQVLSDLSKSDWRAADVVTFSGNGEPTLALNLGECLSQVKEYTGLPTIVLTNGTLLEDPAVRSDLQGADRVFIKLDAATQKTLEIVDNPTDGITLDAIVRGILAFREAYQGYLAIQTMLMPANLGELERLCDLYRRINPDEVQLNTPLRPVPRSWYLASRGNHGKKAPVPESLLRVISPEQALEAERLVRERTGLRVTSVYQPQGSVGTAMLEPSGLKLLTEG